MTIKQDDYVVIEGHACMSAPLKIENKKCKFNRQEFNLLDLEGLEYYMAYKIENDVFTLVGESKQLEENGEKKHKEANGIEGDNDMAVIYADKFNFYEHKDNSSRNRNKYDDNDDQGSDINKNNEEEMTMEERTRRKYKNKKNEKKEKRIIVHELTPHSFHSSLTKRKKTFSLSAIAFLSFYLEKDRSVLIYDDKNALLSYTAFYKNVKNIDVVGAKQSVRKVGDYTIKYTTLSETLGFYDVIILADINDAVENQLLCEKVHSHLNDQLVVYRRNRGDAEKCFEYLLNNKLYVNVRMSDFFCRRYTIESMHPVVRGDYNEGYVITANKVVDMSECLATDGGLVAQKETKHFSTDEVKPEIVMVNKQNTDKEDTYMSSMIKSADINDATSGKRKNLEGRGLNAECEIVDLQTDKNDTENESEDVTCKRKHLSDE